MTIGERIQAARKKKGLSQQELGKILGVSGSMIGQYENDLRNPKIKTIQKISKALEISEFELIFSEEERPKIEKNIPYVVDGMEATAKSYGVDPHKTSKDYWDKLMDSLDEWGAYERLGFINDLTNTTDEEKRKIWEYARFLLEQRKKQIPPED